MESSISVPYSEMKAANPYSLSISIRPYKQASTTGYRANIDRMCRDLIRIVRLEKGYPGSKNAVVDIIMSCALGFEQGIASNCKRFAYLEELRPALDKLFEPFVSDEKDIETFGIHGREEVHFVNHVEKGLNRILSGYNLTYPFPPYSVIMDNLASLFQPIDLVEGEVYRPLDVLCREAQPSHSQRPISSTELPLTIIGQAWKVRLPTKIDAWTPEDRFLHNPVPKIQFAPATVSAVPA
jgi:hypothetical protein